MTQAQRFSTIATADRRGRLTVSVPFDPDVELGPKPLHHVRGTIGGFGYRATLERDADGWRFVLGPAWLRDRPLDVTRPIEVVVEPEGPQRDDLPADLATALELHPDAGAFWDGLAQFYRRAYLTWIGGAARRPELRAARLAELIELLRDNRKERPRPTAS